MLVDLSAGTRYRAVGPALVGNGETMAHRAKILVFDSGLGGLTVLADVTRLRPDASVVYAADDAGFPYGRWSEPDLKARVLDVLGALILDVAPDAVVIACNTISTLVLPDLRARFPALPFVGTVPAIKPAAARSASKMISVLATPGTVARDYTRALIERFAADCDVALVGATRLATIAEAAMAGAPVDEDEIAAEIRPCFQISGAARTDVVVLACTHYPLLLPRFERLAPWPVTWIDPAPAIARRLDAVLRERGMAPLDRPAAPGEVHFTSGRQVSGTLARTLQRHGLLGRPAAVEA